MQRINYPVKGMSCAACVAHVERAVRSVLNEEDQVTVSLLTNSVSVFYQRELDAAALEIMEQRISSAVKAAGYQLLKEAPQKKQADGEYRSALLRLLLSAVFTLSLMYLSMGGMIGLPLPAIFEEQPFWMALSQLALTLPVLILNVKFFRGGIRALLHLAPNMDSLIAVGSGASVIYGVIAIFFIATSGDHAVIHSWIHDLYFESAAMILTLVSLGKLLESGAKNKASDAVRSLATLSPKYATLLRDGAEISVPAEQIQVGDLMLIRAGELIPADGLVVSGEGSADESALTGESMPVEKEIGSSVCAACVLTSGAITVRAEKVGEETSLSRIIRLLEDAAASKAPISRVADRVSRVFVPVVMGISLITFACWMLFTKSVEMSLRSAIAVLVISCPCALGLATPTAITVGIGRGARMGILFRSAEALEKLCGAKTVVLDKTGTVTEGRPSLTDLISYGSSPEEDPARVLLLASAVEHLSSHPLARAVWEGAQGLCEEENACLTLPEVQNFESLVGVGATGIVEGLRVTVGKPDLAYLTQFCNTYAQIGEINTEKKENEEQNLLLSNRLGARVRHREEPSRLLLDLMELEKEGKTAVVVTLEDRPVGILGIADRIREDSKDAVNTLKNAGVTCLMLTGDNERTAAFVAQKANLDGFYASLMPEDKERMVRELSKKEITVMVGDGINDAPALISADVGIAIGAGTEVAIDCAGVVLSGSSLTGVADAYALSRATIRVIKQNLFWALFYNAICIPVAAGVFYPLLGWQLSPMLASAAMSVSSVCVVLNALRLRNITLKGETDMLFGKKETVTHVVSVEGMMCHRCVAHVKEALEGLKGVKSVEVSLENKSATVTAVKSVTLDRVKEAITKAGYQVVE